MKILVKLIEMANLVADARPGDQFFLHCKLLPRLQLCLATFIFPPDSGHGTRLPDDNGDEEDGWDECAYCYDCLSVVPILIIIG